MGEQEFPQIPGYTLKKELGRGGMAAVYLAVQESVQRQVALKVMSPVLLVDPAFSERFLREARIAANLHHRHIVSVYDVGVHGDYHYIAMEYLQPTGYGRKDATAPPDVALRMVIDIASALHYAHEKNFIHRDVKADNILKREDGSFVLTDFGIARASDSATQMTRTGSVIGTPHYMSPEQSRGKAVDGRADLYSLGIVFFELIRGFVPFDGQDSLAVGIKHITDPIPTLPPAFSPYQEFLEKLLAKMPEERYQSGNDVAEAARTLLMDAEHRTAEPTPPKPDVPLETDAATVVIEGRRKSDPGLGDMAGLQDAGLAHARSRTAAPPRRNGKRWAWILFTLVALLLALGYWQRVAIHHWLDRNAPPQLARILVQWGLVGEVAEQRFATDGPQTGVFTPDDAWVRQQETSRFSDLSVAQLLSAAVQALEQGIYTPDDGIQNAFEYYQEVLAREPANSAAKSGLADIAAQLSDAADVSLMVGQDQQARSLVQQLSEYFRNHPRVNPLRTRLGMAPIVQDIPDPVEPDSPVAERPEADSATESSAAAGEEVDSAQSTSPTESIQQENTTDVASTASDEAVPQLTEDTGPGKPLTTADLLSIANQHLQAQRLTQPAGENALDTFQSILRQEPDNIAALNGIATVKSRYQDVIITAIASGDLQRARTLTALGERRFASFDGQSLRNRIETKEREMIAPQSLTDAEQDQVEQLLLAAGQAKQSEQWVSPPGISAFDRYKAVLSIDPTNTLATEGISDLAKVMLDQARAYVGTGELDKAVMHWRQAQMVDASHAELLPLLDQIQAGIQSQIVAAQHNNEPALEAKWRDIIGAIEGYRVQLEERTPETP